MPKEFPELRNIGVSDEATSPSETEKKDTVEGGAGSKTLDIEDLGKQTRGLVARIGVI